jgi:hypothetical protein
MERGDFYASNGVELAEYEAGPRSVRVSVKPIASSKYRIQFLGKGGRLLSEGTESTATYQITGNEGYVRARVLESNGTMAWTQPVMVPAPASGRHEATAMVLVALAAAGGLFQWLQSTIRSV